MEEKKRRELARKAFEAYNKLRKEGKVGDAELPEKFDFTQNIDQEENIQNPQIEPVNQTSLSTKKKEKDLEIPLKPEPKEIPSIKAKKRNFYRGEL